MLKTLLTWFFTFSMSSNSHAGVGNWMETCPAGYILVPKNTEYVDQNFCVMKYEARARNDTTGVIDADGCNEVGCTTSNWGLAANSPASTSSGLPWRQISLANGKAECRSLGPRYDVISNAEWQTIARNIELVPQNWSGGAVGSGCIWYGNSGDNNSCGYDGANPEGGTGRNTRARHFLSNGQEIWDLAGNVTEGVLDDGTQFNYGPQDYIANVTTGTHTTPGILLDGVARVAKNQFGPSGSYTCNAGNEYCGFGYAGISGGGGVMVRGGAWTEVSWAGVFHAINWLAAGTAADNGGFRCVYRPVDPCLSGKVVSSGTRCGGTDQSSNSQLFVGMLNGYDYFATPSGCTNSSTPTCAGGTDTVTTAWRGTTGSNVDIGGITNVGGVATPSDAGQSGETITPIMIADASVASDSPGDYCANMTYAGFTDWFLPSKSETSLLYCAASSGSHNTSMPEDVPDCYTMGGKRNLMTGFATTDGYWASTEMSSNVAWSIMLSNGAQSSDLKSNGGFQRCMRRVASRDPCAGDPAVGTTCRGGPLYAGRYQGGKYMVTPSGCTDSSTPICAGGSDTVQKVWRGTSGGTCTTDNDIAGITNIAGVANTSTQLGHVTTPLITANTTNICTNSAAHYCQNMVFGGYSDWYLPSKSELAYLYCRVNAPSHNPSFPDEDPNCVSVGGKTHDLTGFVTGSYFSSTENSNTNTFGEQFLNGQQGSVGKNNTQYIRCVRRYDPTTIAVNQVSSKFSLADGTTSAGNLGTLPKAGNTIIVTIAIWRSGGSGITSVTDNQGNTYQQAIIQPNVNGNANMAIYYASNIGTPTGTFTITVTPLHGFNNSLEWNAIEVSGLADSPVDRTKSAQSSAGDAATGSSAATRQMDELVVASATHSATDTNINITTAATGYTLIGINQDSQATIGYSSGYKIISTTGAQSATWSHDNTVVEGWAAGLVTFKGK